MRLQEFHGWMPALWGRAPLEEWRVCLQAVCGNFNPVGRDSAPPVTGGVTQADAAGLEIVQVATDVECVRRDHTDIRRDFGEHLFLLLQLEGSCGVEQKGRQSVIAPGDCILVDSSLPSNFYFHGRFSNHLSVHLPRQLLLADSPGDIDISRRLAAEDPMSMMLRALVAKMLQIPATHRRAPEMRRLLLQATRQAFACDANEEAPAPRDRAGGRLELARLLVDRHLTDECLTPQWLANRLGVSLRTLQEDFSTLDDTVTSFIRDRRLRLARDRLREMPNGKAAGTIADIALSSGFNDVSYFNRCFKRAFDCSPREVARA